MRKKKLRCKFLVTERFKYSFNLCYLSINRMNARNSVVGLKRLVLGGTVAVGLSSLYGCEYVAGFLIADHHAHVVARGERDAARIQADAIRDANNNASSNYDSNSPRWEIFTCTAHSDFNHDGLMDPRDISLGGEVVNKGKKEFFVGDTARYVVVLYNCKGRQLEMFGQAVKGEPLKSTTKIIVDSNNRVYSSKDMRLNEPADWQTYLTMDGVKIGEHRITVRENPAISSITIK